jgi:uncharacterized protein YjbJ (UPF0337 family)
VADAKGKAKEKLGWLTGDRTVEAEGRAEQETDDEPGEERVAEKTEEVRKQYGETTDGSDAPDDTH